jgi:hypothetical protein
VAILEVYIYRDGTTWTKLLPTDREDLSRENQCWLSADSGASTKYYWDIEEDIIGLYVKPDSYNAGDNYLKVYYAYDYTEMTDDEEFPVLPVPLHQSMIHYVVAKCFKHRGLADRSMAESREYLDSLRTYITERKREREDDKLIMKSYRNY